MLAGIMLIVWFFANLLISAWCIVLLANKENYFPMTIVGMMSWLLWMVCLNGNV